LTAGRRTLRRLGCCRFSIFVGFMVSDSTTRTGAESTVVPSHMAGKRTDRRTLDTARRVSWCRKPTAAGQD
jgi:hypothetical protein